MIILMRLFAAILCIVLLSLSAPASALESDDSIDLEWLIRRPLRVASNHFVVAVVELVDVSACTMPQPTDRVCIVKARITLEIASRFPAGEATGPSDIMLQVPLSNNTGAPRLGDTMLVLAAPTHTASGVYRPKVVTEPTKEHAEQFLRVLETDAPTAIRPGAQQEIARFKSKREVSVASLTSAVLKRVGPCPDGQIVQCADAAIPTLRDVVADGGRSLDVPGCLEDPNACRRWAIQTLGEIGTPLAKQTLVTMMQGEQDPYLLATTVAVLGSMNVTEAMATFRSLLRANDSLVRAQAVVALGKLDAREYFDEMLEATLTLKPGHLPVGVTGLVLLRDQRAIEPIERHLAKIKEPLVSEQVRELLGRLRSGAAPTPPSYGKPHDAETKPVP